VSVAISYDDLINGAVGEVKSLLDEGAVVLIPPGSSRGKIVGKLQGVGVVAYRKFREGVEVLSVEGGRPLVGGKSLVEYIKGVGKLSESLRGLVIVPRWTIDAVLIRNALYEELHRELGDKKAEELAKELLKFYFPPKYYGEQLKSFVENLEEDLRKAVEVDYSDVLKDVVEDARGVSLKLVKALEMRGIEYVKAGVEAIRGLDPGVVELPDALREAGRRALSALLAAPFTALASVFGGVAAAPAILAVLTASSLGNVKGVIGDFLDKVVHSLGVESLKAPASGFAGRLFEWFIKREPRDKTLTSIARLLKAVVVAKKYVEDDTFEAVVDEVASKWGLSHDTFKHFIDNLYKLATEKLVTEEELERLRSLSDEEFKKRIEELVDERWEKFRKEVEERLDKIEEELEELKKKVKEQGKKLENLGVLLGVYEKPKALGFDLKKKTFEVFSYRYALVTSGRFEEYSSEILEKVSRGEFIILVGPKGVGKSVLARYSLAKALDTGFFVVYEVEQGKLKQLKKLGGVLNTFGKWPVIFYDPSAPEYYELDFEEVGFEEAPEIKKIRNTVIKLISAYKRWKKSGINTSIVVVLPNDIFDTIKERVEEAKKKGVKLTILEVDLRQADFLTDVVKAYSGGDCGEEVYKRLGEYIADNYAGGYTLVAKYAGEWLRQTKCAAEVEEAVKAGGGSAEAFIAQYMYINVFRSNTDFLRKLAIPFIVRAKLGPMPPKWLEKFPALEGNRLVCHGNPLESLTDPEKEFVKNWLSQEHEDIVEGVIKGIVEGELSKRLKSLVEEAKARGVEQTVSTAIVKNVEEMEETIREVLERLGKVEVEGKCKGRGPVEVFFKALANNDEFRKAVGQCREDFAKAVGHAHTPYPLLRELLECQRGGEPLLAGWLISGGAMPRATRLFFISEAEAFDDVVKPCQIIDKVFEDASRKGVVSLRDVALTLGAFAISKDGLRDCLKSAVVLIYYVLQGIPVRTYLLKAKFVEVIKNLIENRVIREVVKLIDEVEGWSSSLTRDLLDILLDIVEKVERGEIDLSSDWVAQVLHEETSFSVYSSLPGKAGELEELALRVDSLVRQECNDMFCLYTKASLGVLLAELLRRFGFMSQARNVIDETTRAVEELEKREGVARELESLLKIFAPSAKPEKVVGRILADLKSLIYGVAHRIYLGFDLEKALNYAEEGYEIAKREGLDNVTLNILRSKIARALFLMGREGEAIQIFRECMKNMIGELYVGYSDEKISAITAEYIASFLAEGRVDEAVEEYRRHKDDVNLRLGPLLLLTSLLHVYGLNVVDEEVERKRREFMVLESRVMPKWRGDAAALAHLYGLTKEECGFKELGIKETAEDWTICKTLLKNVEKPDILRRWLIEQRLLEQSLVEGIEDPVEMLELVVSTASSASSLIEIMRLISRGRVKAARRLAEYLQKVASELGMVVPAGLFGELVSSLEEGKCGDNCKKALLRLFYYHV